MIHSTDQYGATHQPSPRGFVGTEGQQAAMVLRKQILIKMGKNNSSRFLTTKLSEILKEIDELAKPEAGKTLSVKDKLSIQEAKKKAQAQWSKAYWEFKEFFTVDGYANSLLESCDDTLDIPRAWHYFNQHLIGGPSLQGVLMSLNQFYDPTMVTTQAIEEFSRRMKIFHQLEGVAEDFSILEKEVPQKPSLPSPAKSISQTPALNRTLFADDTSQREQEEGSSQQLSSSSSDPPEEVSLPTMRTTTITEWVKVLLVLFMMKNDPDHGKFTEAFIQKFIIEKITERNSVFGITEAIIFDQMRSFSTIREVKAPSVHVNATTLEHCGQKECLDKRRYHTKEDCWHLHPEKRRSKFNRPRHTGSKNDSTSSTKATAKERNRKHARDDKKFESEDYKQRKNNNRNSSTNQSSNPNDRSRAHQNMRTHFMNIFNISENEMSKIESNPGDDSRNDSEDEQGGDHEDFGPPSKIKINMIRTNIDEHEEEHVTVLISDIIADKGHSQSAAADSGTQASVLAMEHRGRCFDARQCSGTIITATGRTAGAIKFRAKTYFLGSAIDVYLADIDCSVVAATVTCRKQNMCWTFGPGDRGSVHNFSTGKSMKLWLREDMWPVPINCFTPTLLSSKSTSTAKPKYNSSAVYSDKLKPKPKYNSIEVYSNKFKTPQTAVEHASTLPLPTAELSSVSTPMTSTEHTSSTSTTTRPTTSTVIEPDIPIGRKAPKPEKSSLWHGRTGHPGSEKLRFCARCSIYRNRGLDIAPGEIDEDFVCESCREASAHKCQSHKNLDKDEFLTGQCWHADATGRKETPALKTGTLIGILFRDRESRFYAGYSVKNNDTAEIMHVIERWNYEELSYWRHYYQNVPNFSFHLHADNLEFKYPEVVTRLTNMGSDSIILRPVILLQTA